MISRNLSNFLTKFKTTFSSVICTHTSFDQPIDPLKCVSLPDQPLKIIQTIYPQPRLNQMGHKIGHLSYAANDPTEDRYQISFLKSIQAQVITVFDGHGGCEMAEFANQHLHAILERCLSENKALFAEMDDLVQCSLRDAYWIMEQELYKLAKEAQSKGERKAGSVGTCALTAILMEDRVYSANVGDCKGIVVDGDCNYKKINHMHNASSKKEQMRLKEIFHDEEDIVVQKKGCYYVKNLLQPTRSLGDYRLKCIEFTSLTNFKGPYINAVPDQQIIELEKGDRYLVMGSDGLWDELSKQEISELVVRREGKVEAMAEEIFEESLRRAAASRRVSVGEMKGMRRGERRRFHDDITIIVVDLRK